MSEHEDRRGSTRRLVAGAVVAVAVAVAVLVVDHLEQPDTEQTDTVRSTGDLPTAWRTEYWHGVSVEVPAAWEWGVAPLRQGGEVLRCGGPDPGTAYVGRPVSQSDVCRGGVPTDPAAPYVWLDAPVEPGTVDVGNGYTQETVDGDGTTVTVATDDDALRERIVDSVAPQILCRAATGERGPGGATPVDGLGGVRTFEMCAYAQGEDGSYRLVYGAELGTAAYERWRRATGDPPQVDLDCPHDTELVVLKGGFDGGAEPLSLTWVVDLPCGQVRSADGAHALTDEMTAPWADGGVRGTLSYFLGPQG
jgi:hypothetical protein